MTDPGAGHPAGHIPLSGPAFVREPARLYRELRREHGPVAPVLLDGDVPAWLVLGYREIHQVTGNPQVFARAARRWPGDDGPPVLAAEGAEHRQRADALGRALAAVDQFELRGHCERVADDLVDTFARDGVADLMAQYAQPMPGLVLATMFGFADADAPVLVSDLTRSLDGGQGAGPAHLRVAERMGRLVEQRRRRPGPDVASRLIAHRHGLTDAELTEDLLVALAAAQQPTAHWIGNAIRLMLTDIRFAMTLSGGRRSVGHALNDVLWEDTPTQNSVGRCAVRTTQLGGRRIMAGDLLVLGLAAANADPRVRPSGDPGSIGNRAHLSFGRGEHRCPFPAPEIGQVIANGAVEVLLDRLPDVALAVAAGQLGWRESVWLRGLASLPVEFTPP